MPSDPEYGVCPTCGDSFDPSNGTCAACEKTLFAPVVHAANGDHLHQGCGRVLA
jgi:predicted amidophosphoribosyltransferase